MGCGQWGWGGVLRSHPEAPSEHLLCAELPGVWRAGDADSERGVCVGMVGPAPRCWQVSTTRQHQTSAVGPQEETRKPHTMPELKRREARLKFQEGVVPKKTPGFCPAEGRAE